MLSCPGIIQILVVILFVLSIMYASIKRWQVVLIDLAQLYMISCYSLFIRRVTLYYYFSCIFCVDIWFGLVIVVTTSPLCQLCSLNIESSLHICGPASKLVSILKHRVSILNFLYLPLIHGWSTTLDLVIATGEDAYPQRLSQPFHLALAGNLGQCSVVKAEFWGYIEWSEIGNLL